MFELTTKNIIIIGLIVAVLFIFGTWSNKNQQEGFINPYSLILHAEMMPKHDRWDVTHRKPFFNNRYGVLQSYRE